MEQFIIIGGPTRSGTNTVSLFLHLHEDVVSFGSAMGLHPLNLYGSFCKKLSQKKECLQEVGIFTGHVYFAEYLDRKNVDFRKEMTATWNKKITALRWDYGESIFPIMLGLVPQGVRLKMITCLRPINLVFRSQFRAKHIISNNDESVIRKAFSRRVGSSFAQLKHISSKLPDRLLFVDITGEDAPEYYVRILKFLDLQANDFQLEWIEKLPITNDTNWHLYGNPQYRGSFEELEEARQELLTIGRPK